MSKANKLPIDNVEIVTGKLRLTGDRVLVKPLEWDHGCKHIFVIRHGDPVRGVVMEVGPGIYPVSKRIRSPDNKGMRIEFSPRFQPTEVKVGDIVELGGLNIFDGHGYQFPNQVIYNGELCFFCTERDVAIVRDDLSIEAQYGAI